MTNKLIAMSLAMMALSACASGVERNTGGKGGNGGTTGAAGSAAAGTTGAAGEQGAAGTTDAAGTTGAAGDVGVAGSTGAAGDQGAAGTTGTAGTTGAAGDQGAAGTSAAGTTGAAGDQGTAGAGGTTGTAGATGAVACNNSAVVTAGGLESNCPAKATWKATAMPTPASKYKGIADTQLQPQYAIDGMPGTRYSSGMTMADGFYFQVDLGAAKMVSGITVDTSEGADSLDVAAAYEVGLSTDGKTFTTVASCLSAAAPMEVVNFKATMARYVRYTNKGAPGPSNGATSWLAIHELDILCN